MKKLSLSLIFLLMLPTLSPAFNGNCAMIGSFTLVGAAIGAGSYLIYKKKSSDKIKKTDLVLAALCGGIPGSFMGGIICLFDTIFPQEPIDQLKQDIDRAIRRNEETKKALEEIITTNQQFANKAKDLQNKLDNIAKSQARAEKIELFHNPEFKKKPKEEQLALFNEIDKKYGLK